MSLTTQIEYFEAHVRTAKSTQQSQDCDYPNGGAAQCFGRTVMLTGLLVVTPPALSVARAVTT
jgi:hypothetical protein